MFYIILALEALAFLTGLLLFRKIKPVIYRLIVFVLLLTVVNEGLVVFGVYQKWHVPKYLFYNIFFLIQLIVFLLIFYFSYEKQRAKLVTGLIGIAGIVVSSLALQKHGIMGFNPYFVDSIAGSIILLGCSYLYFQQAKEKLYHPTKDPLFWFSSGLIIANFFLLLFISATFLKSFTAEATSTKIVFTLTSIGNLLYYSFIIISMLCSSRSPKLVGT
ncbi:MAG: hypothetical protein DI535_10335 [Citrobacter freundii]|nr:MAG: hypothetical protein DI535_10335 [Citrobacter freundii]